ncbi:heavy metal RND transporter [Aureimonas sp. Leaf454]|uniref:FixH family protein n=1 Tax=Aureimonas sp. Leaf454 TaxID=1736381 RepID=UPI0006FF5A23|nr:FixH family protein [Aureimonas sp. Leaf454]KQT51200.1 heavy metal RND transporter [Aureimonas sp. Leaf454]
MNELRKHVAAAALVACLSTGLAGNAAAAMTDYEFQLVDGTVAMGKDIPVRVRLVDKRTGMTVPDAVIFETRLDMAPDGMETMTAPVEVAPSPEPGIYVVKGNFVMAGGWRISLGAKVQGEEGTLRNELVLKATE